MLAHERPRHRFAPKITHGRRRRPFSSKSRSSCVRVPPQVRPSSDAADLDRRVRPAFGLSDLRRAPRLGGPGCGARGSRSMIVPAFDAGGNGGAFVLGGGMTDRRRRSPVASLARECRLCWRPFTLNLGRVELLKERVLVRCAHCGGAFSVRREDVAPLFEGATSSPS